MEEDINILEEFIKDYEAVTDPLEQSAYFEEVPAKTIRNIINKYEEQEKIIELMADCIRCVDIDDDKHFEHTERCYVENACRNCMIDYFKKKAKGE